MPDIAQFDFNSSPPIVYGMTTNNQTKRHLVSIEPNVNNNSNRKLKVSVLNKKTFSYEKRKTTCFNYLKINCLSF